MLSSIIEEMGEKTRQNKYIYPKSLQRLEKGYITLAKIGGEKVLLLINATNWLGYNDFSGNEMKIGGSKVKIAPTNHENACALRWYFPFTAPMPLGNNGCSMGMGDRLGLATPGHVRAIDGTGIKPVFAQQSIRELTLTGRSFTEVLDDVTWGVFQEGYQSGFGADGDHLKHENEVKEALDAGYTMITLDCSEKLDNTIGTKASSEIAEVYNKQKTDIAYKLEDIYLEKNLTFGRYKLYLDELNFKKIVLTYLPAINHIENIYKNNIMSRCKEIDFEISIDETTFPTSPEAHFFVAAELERRDIKVTSIAPRFIGEFQKGIDYIGDISKFEKQFMIHAAIAAFFGYKLSIHSGSDKFKVFPIIGKYTRERLHLKTAGTSWLEALKVVARYQPQLLCAMYRHALMHVDKARSYYQVGMDITKMPAPETVTEDNVKSILRQDDTRQLMHITYGFFLHPEAGVFREKIYSLLKNNEEAYLDILKKHFSKHIELINMGQSSKGGMR
ncbi:hypothetical protein hamaS1_23910 [Moorella sp. Hama-1]|nr:hypothetical protein hamaS1_23910 [Moorella sp. Hama-1]